MGDRCSCFSIARGTYLSAFNYFSIKHARGQRRLWKRQSAMPNEYTGATVLQGIMHIYSNHSGLWATEILVIPERQKTHTVHFNALLWIQHFGVQDSAASHCLNIGTSIQATGDFAWRWSTFEGQTLIKDNWQTVHGQHELETVNKDQVRGGVYHFQSITLINPTCT